MTFLGPFSARLGLDFRAASARSVEDNKKGSNGVANLNKLWGPFMRYNKAYFYNITNNLTYLPTLVASIKIHKSNDEKLSVIIHLDHRGFITLGNGTNS